MRAAILAALLAGPASAATLVEPTPLYDAVTGEYITLHDPSVTGIPHDGVYVSPLAKAAPARGVTFLTIRTTDCSGRYIWGHGSMGPGAGYCSGGSSATLTETVTRTRPDWPWTDDTSTRTVVTVTPPAPIPLPAGAWLLLSAVAALWWRRR